MTDDDAIQRLNNRYLEQIRDSLKKAKTTPDPETDLEEENTADVSDDVEEE